jgi:hypothetical protein
MCLNIYMLYYLENTYLIEYKTCEHAHYKPITGRGRTLIAFRKLRYFSITLRLQMLFMSSKTNKHIIWHHSNDMVDEVMLHSSNGEAYKYFNKVYPQFLIESINVHCRYIDEFNPFRSFVTPYSCWLVILMVYNLPSGMCMRSEFVFLSTIIPSPNSMDRNIYVYLRPLIDELKQLWSSKTMMYDVSRKQNF